MITLSLENSPAAPRDAVSSPAAPAQPTTVTDQAMPSPSRPKPAPAQAASPLAALSKAELQSAGKTPSHGRRFGLGWLQFGRAKKRLQTLESVSLGDKRFIALVRVDDRQFLIGGAPSSVGLLTELAHEETFHQVLNEATRGMEVTLNGPAPELVTAQVAADTSNSSAVSSPDTEAVTDSVVISVPPRLSPEKAGSEPSLRSSTPFHDALLQAYGETSLPAAGSATASVKTHEASNEQQSASVPQPLELSLPVASAGSPGVEPQPVLPMASQPRLPDLEKASIVPSFTFQSWPNTQRAETARPAPARRPAPQGAGFTWSFTGAAS